MIDHCGLGSLKMVYFQASMCKVSLPIDFQKTILVNFTAVQPNMQLSKLESNFTGSIWKREAATKDDENSWAISLKPSSDPIVIENICDQIIDVELFNDTRFFQIDMDSKLIEPKSPIILHVKPSLDAIMKNADLIRRERYLLEHITVYNRNNLDEKYRITLRLNFGSFDLFEVLI